MKLNKETRKEFSGIIFGFVGGVCITLLIVLTVR